MSNIEILNSGIYHIYKRFRFLQWLYYEDTSDNAKKWHIQISIDYNFFLSIVDSIDVKIIKQCEKLFNAHRRKSQRLRVRIDNLLLNDCLFLTLTFTNEVLSNTNTLTRRKYVSRFLKSFNVPYIANIDFGKLTEREHYHAILQLPRLDLNSYEFGFIYAEKINNKNSLSLAKYINKLTNHALKETVGEDRLIYSR